MNMSLNERKKTLKKPMDKDKDNQVTDLHYSILLSIKDTKGIYLNILIFLIIK